MTKPLSVFKQRCPNYILMDIKKGKKGSRFESIDNNEKIADLILQDIKDRVSPPEEICIKGIDSCIDYCATNLRSKFLGEGISTNINAVSNGVFGKISYDIDRLMDEMKQYDEVRNLRVSSDFIGRDFVSISDYSKTEIDFVLNIADKIKNNSLENKILLDGKIMAPLFFENSTRTLTSFQTAMYKLGGNVLDFDVDTSSIKKGETLRDTLKVIESYGSDVVVMRHKLDGSCRYAADIINIPLINAGDGQNEHPTQTMLDLFTIKEIRGKIDGVKIAFVGDLRYGRTVHSLPLALSLYEGCKFEFISTDYLQMPENILKQLDKKGVSYETHGLDRLKDFSKDVHIGYFTRVQRERFPEGPEGEQEYESLKKEYCFCQEMISKENPDFRIMHPLPKVFEIERSIDDIDSAYYFKQAGNGVPVRMAILGLHLGGIYE